jgi:peptidoglycan/LPS O-acetylase OafA/YrhL
MKQPGYIGWMDELRGIAVLMVVVYHALFWTYGQLHYGWNEMGIRSPSTGGIPWYFAPFTLGWGGGGDFLRNQWVLHSLKPPKNRALEGFFH